MARDYENIHDLEDLDDIELRDLVRERIREHTALDLDSIVVKVAEGHVELSGRVGTDGERRIAEHVLTDTLGIMEFTNNLVVDSLARAESPMAIDDHLADEEARSGTLLGDTPAPLNDEAAHLADDADSDLAGTTDYTQVMDNGNTWNPPEAPTPEGMDSSPGDLGERH